MKLITNGRLITRDAEGRGYYEHGAVAYEGARIAEVGEEAALRAKYPDAEIVDAKGGVIMPAFINAHTHIYSALARGLSIVGNNPTNFYEVLDGTWWAIDRHLMMDGTKASATALLPVLRGQRPRRRGEVLTGHQGKCRLHHGMRAAQGSHARGDVRRSRALHHLR